MIPLVIGLVGLQGCGKGTVTEILRTQHHATVFRYSTILGDILTRLDLTINRDHQVKLSEVLRQGFGDEILTHALLHDILSASSPLIVLDGIRRLPELESLLTLPRFVLVKIESSLDTRYERIRQRKEKAGEQGMSRETFLAHEAASTEVTIPPVMERADYRIQNNSTLEELAQHIDALLTELTSIS